MLCFWWGCRGNLKLITFESERLWNVLHSCFFFSSFTLFLHLHDYRLFDHLFGFFSCYQNKELLMQGRPSGQGQFFFRQDSVTRSSKPDRPLKYKPRYVKTRKPPPTFESGLWCTGAYYKGRGVAWGAVGARKNEAMQGTGTRIYCGCSIALLTGGGGGTVFLPSPFSPPPPPPFILPPKFSCAPWSGPSEDVVCPCSSISICSHV